jgi:ATP-dependent DNA helicase DinG
MRRLANLLRDLAQKLKDRNPYASGSGTAELNVYEPEERRAGKRSQKAKPKQASGEAGAGDEAEQRRTYELAIEALGSTATKLLTISSNKRDDDFVRFAVRVFDRRHISLELHAAPINPAAMLTKHLFHPINEEGAALSRTVICTSATLATHGAFEHFKARCGIETTGEEWVLPAVFDYPRQALLYQPPLPPFNFKQPDPYYDGVAQEIARLIEVSRGRTLCLFTSWSGLQQVNDRLQQPGNEVIWPLRAQGDAPRNALLTWFKETPHSVLLATRSFWEGVDIPGDDLSLVVMDKLPFPTPNDPLHSARATAIDEAGGSSFGEYSLPLMTLTLKQGFGRLIRRATDQGVVAILDERLSSKSYGKQARQDLPAARFCREFKDVHRFFQTGLETDAEFALNVWATPALSPKLAGLEVGGATGVRWRWQLLRLVDGKADRADGVLHGVEPPQAELHAAIAGLMDLKRRIEGAKRSPNDFTVEVRCSPAAAELALTGKTPAWGEARRVWGGLHFVWLERPLSAGG